jgi:hypothetical protein
MRYTLIALLLFYMIFDFLLSSLLLLKTFFNQIKFNSRRYSKILLNGEKGKVVEKAFESLASFDLKIGDIIKLSKHEVCPRDILVLATSDRKQNESFTMVDETSFRDKLGTEKKFALEKLYSKNSLEEVTDFKKYVKSLSLEIEFDN